MMTQIVINDTMKGMCAIIGMDFKDAYCQWSIMVCVRPKGIHVP